MSKSSRIALVCLIFALCSTAFAAENKKSKYSAPEREARSVEETEWAREFGPWDFSGLVGFYNPGIGFQALGAYRILDDIIANADDSLSIESGLALVSVSESLGGTNVTYTAFEVPIGARWDFRIPDTPFIVGPKVGVNFLSSGSSVTVNGVTYNSRGGGVYFQAGGYAIYRFSDSLWGRAGVGFGGYTTISVGVTFAL